MAGKASFTPDEWNLVRRAPAMAGLVVVAASPSGPLGVLRESMAMGQVMADAKAQSGSSELVTALATELTSTEGRGSMELSELLGKSPDQIRTFALDAIQRAVALVDRKAPAESQALRRWLLTIGEKVAAAAKEGGFLGIGGTEISDKEKTAITDLGRSLGIAA